MEEKLQLLGLGLFLVAAPCCWLFDFGWFNLFVCLVGWFDFGWFNLFVCLFGLVLVCLVVVVVMVVVFVQLYLWLVVTHK